jgi:hypothetical protein
MPLEGEESALALEREESALPLLRPLTLASLETPLIRRRNHGEKGSGQRGGRKTQAVDAGGYWWAGNTTDQIEEGYAAVGSAR